MSNEDSYDIMLVRHYALEFIVRRMLKKVFSDQELLASALHLDARADVLTSDNRAGASMTRESVFGMNAPIVRLMAEMLADAAAPDLQDGEPSGVATAPMQCADDETSAVGSDGEPSVVVRLFPKHVRLTPAAT